MLQDLTAGRSLARSSVLREAPRDQSVVGIGGQTLSLEFYHKFDGLEPLWDDVLAAGAEASVFQSFDWLSTWARTAAPLSGEQPLIVIARGPDNGVRMVLPLGIETVAGLPVIGFLGQSHASYGLALVEPGIGAAMSAADVRELFKAIARRVPIAAVRLDRQPATWNGRRNPFAASHSWVSANDSYVLALDGAFEGHFARLFSTKTRQTLRRKFKRLGDLGALGVGLSCMASERARLLETFLAAKSLQLREGGIGDLFSEPGIMAFYRGLLDIKRGGSNMLEISRIEAGGEIGSIALLVSHQGRRYLLNTALCSPLLRDGSPGLQVLIRDIEAADTAGLARYDFGPGAAAYKSAWKPEAIPLLTSVFAASAVGLPLVAHMTASIILKRTIKRNPAIWQFARSMRRSLFGAPKSAAPLKSCLELGSKGLDEAA